MSVSVCMAVKNGEAYLRDQVESILNQLSSADELIISDDGSTDNTLRILHAYQDKRIKILLPQLFDSPSLNFQYTLRHAVNEFIFLADQDDVWYEHKIKTMVAELQSNDLVVCDCRLVDENLKELQPSYFRLYHSGSGLIKNLIKSSFIGCCMGFRRNLLKKALPFPEHTMHDLWIGLMAQKYFKVAFIPQILVNHRIHQRNYSTTGMESKNSLNEKLRTRLQLIINLIRY